MAAPDDKPAVRNKRTFTHDRQDAPETRVFMTIASLSGGSIIEPSRSWLRPGAA